MKIYKIKKNRRILDNFWIYRLSRESIKIRILNIWLEELLIVFVEHILC